MVNFCVHFKYFLLIGLQNLPKHWVFFTWVIAFFSWVFFKMSKLEAWIRYIIILCYISNDFHRYSLVLNRKRASCIRHNLDFPRSSSIAIMFLSKKVGLYFTLVFNFSCLIHSMMMMSLLHLWGNAMSTNPPWSLSFEFSGSCITQRFLKKVQHVF